MPIAIALCVEMLRCVGKTERQAWNSTATDRWHAMYFVFDDKLIFIDVFNLNFQKFKNIYSTE